MTDFEKESLETLRSLSLQVMLIAAGVFGIVGGFISATGKEYETVPLLIIALVSFSLSALAGYVVHGSLVSLLKAQQFSPNHCWIQIPGFFQIGLSTLGGILFTVFVVFNL